MKKYLIILAGGVGNRLQANTAKQFLLLGGKPIVMHTIEKFLTNPKHQFNIILVLNKMNFGYWQKCCEEFNFNHKIEIVAGGKERFHSVKNALDTITDSDCYVGVHDGVRPFVAERVITEAFLEVVKYDAVVPAVPMIPTIRMIDGVKNKSMNRNDFKIVQTPQVFRYEVIQKCYETAYQTFFFDDATVVEYCGYPIKLIDGNEENIKITLPVDYITAKGLLKTDLHYDISYK